jgi:gliding motility-associated-like protein
MRNIYKLLFTIVSISLSLQVHAAAPVANFSASPLSGCAPIVVQFTDLSTGNPTSWSWDLGNNTTSTLQNPSTTYITPGMYTITLTVSNANGTDTKTLVNYINVLPSPTVNFMGVDSGVSCPPKTVQFTDLSNPNIPGNVSYYWDFGDGNTSTLQNPSHTYTLIGNYTVTLVITNASGCQKSLTKPAYIQLVEAPVANFTSPNPDACSAPATISFTNSSTNATSYLWNFGDNTTSIATNPSHTYASPGTYTVTLIATNAAGCTDTMVRTAYVHILDIVSAFTPSVNSVCAGTSVTFTNNSTGATSYNWNFGDNTTSNATNPSHSYNTAGTYTVRLIANNGSCADTSYQTITVEAKPVVNFTGTPLTACMPPLDVTFTNTTTGATSYFWSYGDASTSTNANPTHVHTYTSYGNFTVKLVATSAAGCKDSLTRVNYVKITQATATINATPTTGCTPLTVSMSATLNNPNVVSTFSWDYGDGTPINTVIASPTHTYTTAGTYTITYTFVTTTGCTGTATKVVTASPHPTANFTENPIVICPNQSVTFTNLSTNATSYLWKFGDGGTSTATNPTHTYGDPGQYTVTLIAYNGGCTDTMQFNYIIVNLPHADFTFAYSCANRLTVTFTNTSQGNDINSWDFGDATPLSNAVSPTHTYATYGTYNVTLTVTNTASGCTDVQTYTIVLFPLVPSFTGVPTNICRNQAVVFTNTSQGGSSYKWDFGDNTTSTATNPTHTYISSGVYTVKLVVTDSRGCKDSIVNQSYITVGGPIADFMGTPTTGCAALTVNFTDQSTSPLPITTRLWRFGDNTTLGGNNLTPSHIYYNPGTYSVTLVLTDQNGCMDSFKKNNYIHVNKPTAAFTSPDTLVCPGQNVHFNNASTGNATLTYQWDFGDNTTSTATNPDHSYATGGYYTVRLIVTDGGGCLDTLTRTNYIHVYDFSASFIMSDSFASCPPLIDNFTNTSQNASTFLWTFGNASSSVLANPSTVYTYPGVYTVQLVVTSATGCMDSTTKTVTINGPTGTLNYPPLNGCEPLTVTLTTNYQNTVQVTWDMNNGYTETNNNTSITYTYTQPGMYIPVIILSDGGNCNVAIQGTDTIKVDGINASMSLTPSVLCASGTVQFSDTTWGTITGINSIDWNFGDNTTGTGHNPSHFYAAPGVYTVSMVATTMFGCSDTITNTVTVNPPPPVNAGPDQAVCLGETTTLHATGATSYLWNNDPTLSCLPCDSPNATPTGTTWYVVTGTDTNGCTKADTVLVTVNTLPVMNTSPDQDICPGAGAQLTASGAQTYSWSPATGLSCTNCNNPVANPDTTTTYLVTGVVGATGCSDTASVTVNLLPQPTVSAGPDKEICFGKSTRITATGGLSYVWSPASSLSCSTCDTPVAAPTTTTVYSLVGTGANGCTDTANVTVTVNPLPVIDAGTAQAVCQDESLQLHVTGAATYNWIPTDYLSCSNCADPFVTPTNAITYTIVGVDSHGCVDTTTLDVTIIPRAQTTASLGDSICKGSSTQLSANGGTSYLWLPATGLNDNQSATPTANPDTTTTYMVIIGQGQCHPDTAFATVSVFPLPTVELGDDMTVVSGTVVTLNSNAENATHFEWTPTDGFDCTDCPAPKVAVINTTTFVVIATNPKGCEATDSVTIKVKCDKSQVFIPNTFTPNGDGLNDRFYPSGKGISVVKRLSVFDRWGELLFERHDIPIDDPSNGWDGTYKGTQLKPDVYVYIISAVCATTGEVMDYKGDISIVR